MFPKHGEEHRALVGRIRQILWWLAGTHDIRPQRSGYISLSQQRGKITKAPSTSLPTPWYHNIPPKRKHHPTILAIYHFLTYQNKTHFLELGRNLRGKCPFSFWSLIEWFYPEDWLLSERSKGRGMMRPAWPLWWKLVCYWLCLHPGHFCCLALLAPDSFPNLWAAQYLPINSQTCESWSESISVPCSFSIQKFVPGTIPQALQVKRAPW